jgi:hypothetical protein
MHPMEFLRHVAGATWADPRELVGEAAWAMRAMADDRAALVLVARRLVEHHPTSGAMWWLASHAISARDPHERLGDLIDELESDATDAALAMLEHDVSIVEVSAMGRGARGIEAIVDRPSSMGASTVLAARVGVRLPEATWAVVRAFAPRGSIVEVTTGARLVGPHGAESLDGFTPESPPCPELVSGVSAPEL